MTRGRLFFFKQKAAYELGVRLVGSEMCISERQEPVATPCEIARLGTASCGRLVRIDALRFRPDAEQAVPQTWEGYRLFEDAAGRTIAVYTSAYARFADREIPAGECSLTGVLEYGTAGSYGKQFILQMRDENDCTH